MASYAWLDCLDYDYWISVSLYFQRLNFIDAATGSLGQGLSIAAGMAYVGKYLDKARYYAFHYNNW